MTKKTCKGCRWENADIDEFFSNDETRGLEWPCEDCIRNPSHGDRYDERQRGE